MIKKEELEELTRRTDARRAFDLYDEKADFLKAHEDHYKKYGYATGNYLFACSRCRLMMVGDKSARTCWICVDKVVQSIKDHSKDMRSPK